MNDSGFDWQYSSTMVTERTVNRKRVGVHLCASSWLNATTARHQLHGRASERAGGRARARESHVNVNFGSFVSLPVGSTRARTLKRLPAWLLALPVGWWQQLSQIQICPTLQHACRAGSCSVIALHCERGRSLPPASFSCSRLKMHSKLAAAKYAKSLWGQMRRVLAKGERATGSRPMFAPLREILIYSRQRFDFSNPRVHAGGIHIGGESGRCFASRAP